MIRNKRKVIKSSIVLLVALSFFSGIFFSNNVMHLLFPKKVWIHRVNTIEKLNRIPNSYQGIELDIQYSDFDTCFFISHSKLIDDSVSLSNFMHIAKTNFDRKYWLDFKNLTKDNSEQALNVIVQLLDDLELEKGNFIIESTKPAGLIPYSIQGFKTSYYLPQNLRKLPQVELANKRELIAENMSKHPAAYLSTEYKDYKIVKELFPESEKLFWFTTYGSLNKIYARFLLYRVLLDQKVRVLLIAEK